MLVVSQLFTKMFEHLAQKYENQRLKDRLYFVTLVDPSMVTDSINIEAFNPGLETPEQLGSMLSKILNSYLQSNASLKMNGSFKIYIVVYSPEHSDILKAKKIRNGGVIIHGGGDAIIQPIGAKLPIKRRCFKDIPRGFDSQENAFDGLCSIVAIIISYYMTVTKEANQSQSVIEKGTKISNLWDRTKCKRIAAGKLILIESQKLQATYKELEGRHHYLHVVCPILAEHFKSQIHVFTSLDPQHCDVSFPSPWNSSMRPLYIFQDINVDGTEDQFGHIFVIPKIDSYFRVYQVYCFACKKSLGGTQYKHKCGQLGRKLCISCELFLPLKNMYVNSDTKNDYCGLFESEKTEKTKACDVCQVVPRHDNCKHKCKGYKCTVCNMFTSTSGNNANVQAIIREHKHFEKRCSNCRDNYDKRYPHNCTVWIPDYTNIGEHSRLATLHAQELDNSSLNCLDCLDKMCQFHLSKVDENMMEAVLFTLYYESERGVFKKVVFCHPDLQKRVELNFDSNDLDCTSLLPNEILKSSLPITGKKVQFGKQQRKNCTLQLVVTDKTLLVEDEVLKFLIFSPELHQVVVMVLGQEMVIYISSF
jgi:hypothetical protein